MTKLHHQVKD